MSKAVLDAETLLRLVRKMGHDIRAPLGSLISTSDMLAEEIYGPLSPQQTKANERIRRNSRRVLAVLDDFITYAKAEAEQIAPMFKPFDPRQKLMAWCDLVRDSAEDKGLTLELTIEQLIPTNLFGDEALISRVVLALLWNAVAYTHRGGISVYSDWTDDHRWMISVQDSGPGIPAEIATNVFEPFWRGEDRPQLPTAGAGLGLPLARALTQLMQGDLFIAQTGSGGTTFCMQLPMSSDEESAPTLIMNAASNAQ